MPEDVILKKEFWGNFIKSNDYKHLLNVFEEHKKYLNKEALLSLQDNKIHEAIRFQAKLEDTGRIVDLIKEAIKEVENG